MTTENFLRKPYSIPFVQVPRDLLINQDISWKAKGLMAYMMDKPDNWKFSITGISAQGKESEDAIKSGLNELKKFGYLKIVRIKDPLTKRFTHCDWILTPFQNIFPQVENPPGGNSTSGKSGTSNTLLQKDSSKEESKKEIEKKDATSANASALCDFLLKEIKSKKPNSIAKISTSWIKAADKLLKVRTIEELKAVIHFMANDPFMSQWTFSMGKVLSHLDTAEARMQKGATPGAKSEPAPPPLDVEKVQKNKNLAEKLMQAYNSEGNENKLLKKISISETEVTFHASGKNAVWNVNFYDAAFEVDLKICVEYFGLKVEGI